MNVCGSSLEGKLVWIEKGKMKPREHAKHRQSFISFEMPVVFYLKRATQETVHFSAKPELQIQSLALKNIICIGGI